MHGVCLASQESDYNRLTVFNAVVKLQVILYIQDLKPGRHGQCLHSNGLLY